MDKSEFSHLRDDFYSSKVLKDRVAITDKQFTSDA
jgi:hypothetical protein